MNEWVNEWMSTFLLKDKKMVKMVKKLQADHQGVLLGGIG